jgi:ribonuclease HI
MQVAASHKFVLFAIWLLLSTTITPTAAFVFEPERARTTTMMIRSPRAFTAMQAIPWRSVLGQTTTATTTAPGGQSLRLFSSKSSMESASFELNGNVTLKAVAVPPESPEKKITRTSVRRMTNDQIKAELEKRGMPSTGNKTERADRLLTIIPSKRGSPKSVAETIAANHTINNNRTINNNNHNIANQKNETVYQEATPIHTDIDIDETMPSEESKKESGPVEIPPTDTNMFIATMPEDSNKEPGPIDPTRTYILRVKGASTKRTGGTGVGVVLEDSEYPTLCWTARKYLSGDRSIFEAEYTGLIVGLRYAIRRGVRNIKLEIDHDVTMGHMKGIYEVTKPELIPMFQTIMEIRDSLHSFSISRITKKENHKAQDLAHKAHATRISMHIEDSVDPMEGQDSQGKRSRKVPEQQQKSIEVSVDPPEDQVHREVSVDLPEDQDQEVIDEEKLPEQQQEPAAKPIEQATPVETNESIVAETVQPDGIQIDPTRFYRLEFDGGARGNQYSTTGKSGAGAVIYDDRGLEVWCAWKYLSKMTNNAAEYEALLLGLEGAKSLGIELFTVFGDSQLIVNQVNGKNKVSNASMKEYWRLVMPLKRSFKSITINHFLRDENKRADQLANHAMDTETTHQELRRFDKMY